MKACILTLVILLSVVSNPLKSSTPLQTAVPESRLRLFHTHTGEHIDIVFRRRGEYVAGALTSLNHFLRDHRTGDVHEYDPRVFDLLADLTKSVGRAGSELQIICGYRTPWSNE
ncbi:MAG: DUF882 domain-containing protein, partial [Acidobacteriota bacterium]